MKKWHILVSSTAVSLIWVFWHLPYFLLPDSLQSGQNFFSYIFIGIVTGFILTAIYLLTESVFLCMLFHSWQNTLVMSIPADTRNPWFMLTFLLLGESPAPETTVQAQEPTGTTPLEEEKPSVRDNFPTNGFLWAVLCTAIVLVLYFVTNIF